MINTHHLTVGFGKHKGELWTRVPVSYLRWLVNSEPLNGSNAHEIAAAELKRRGSTLPTIEVSGHAIDSASLRCRRTWHETAKNAEEGLHAWLLRMAAEAWAAGEGAEVIEYAGIRWVFAPGEEWPVLKTVTLG